MGCRLIRSTLMANLMFWHKILRTILCFMITIDLRTCSLHKMNGWYLPNQTQLLLFPEPQWSFSNNIITTLHFWGKAIMYNNDWSHRNSQKRENTLWDTCREISLTWGKTEPQYFQTVLQHYIILFINTSWWKVRFMGRL